MPLFVSLYIRVMCVSNVPEQNKQMIGIHEVLSAIMVPTKCQQSAMKLYFERDTKATDKVPCKKFCSFCSGRVMKHGGKFKKDTLTSLFVGELFNAQYP